MRMWKRDARGKDGVSVAMPIHFVAEAPVGGDAAYGCEAHKGVHICVPGLITSIDPDDRVNVVLFVDENIRQRGKVVSNPAGASFRTDLRWGGECDVGRIHLFTECEQ